MPSTWPPAASMWDSLEEFHTMIHLHLPEPCAIICLADFQSIPQLRNRIISNSPISLKLLTKSWLAAVFKMRLFKNGRTKDWGECLRKSRRLLGRRIKRLCGVRLGLIIQHGPAGLAECGDSLQEHPGRWHNLVTCDSQTELTPLWNELLLDPS